MSEIEKITAFTRVKIEPLDPALSMAQSCLDAYANELNQRFETGFETAKSLSATADDLRPPNGAFLVATLNGRFVGCGALKFNGDGPTEVKRMWVSPDVRGFGIGRRLLEALEHHARANGTRVLHLETNRVLVEAIGLYRSAGYQEIEAFNNERYAHHWFEKQF
jgi:GNAT superfamily N-acetyltransferase